MTKENTNTNTTDSTTYSSYKQSVPFENRLKEYKLNLEKYPDKISVIIEKDSRSNIPDISRKKCLVSKDMTYNGIVLYIRKGLKLGPEKGLFIFVSNYMINSMNSTIGELHDLYRDEDGHLYITYALENTFGYRDSDRSGSSDRSGNDGSSGSSDRIN